MYSVVSRRLGDSPVTTVDNLWTVGLAIMTDIFRFTSTPASVWARDAAKATANGSEMKMISKPKPSHQ